VEESFWIALQEATRAETERVRADVDKMPAQFRAVAARERDEMRADLRARAERAEQEAGAYRAELSELHAELGTLRGRGDDASAPRLSSAADTLPRLRRLMQAVPPRCVAGWPDS